MKMKNDCETKECYRINCAEELLKKLKKTKTDYDKICEIINFSQRQEWKICDCGCVAEKNVSCVHCGYPKVEKWGHTQLKRQRFRCIKCKKTFTIADWLMIVNDLEKIGTKKSLGGD